MPPARAADSLEIGMGAMKSGLAYAWAVEKEEFWITHPFSVGYPIHRMSAVYGFRSLETVLDM